MNSDPANWQLLVIGLGNPILGDDGVGWEVVRSVENSLRGHPELTNRVVFEYLSLGGLSLMEYMVDFQQVILVDALHTNQLAVGSVRRYEIDDLPNVTAGHLASAHDTSLHTALEVGRQAGARLPDTITVIGIESPYVYDFSDQLSPLIASAVPLAAAEVINVIEDLLRTRVVSR